MKMEAFNIWQECGAAWRFLGTLEAPGKKAVSKALAKFGVDEDLVIDREAHLDPWANPQG